MHQLNKLLLCISKTPELFKTQDVGFMTGLTNTQIKELKKYATANNFIIEKQRSFYLTSKGSEYLEKNPVVAWKNEEFFKRPEVNLEYLKLEKTPPTTTKAIRMLARHLLSNEELKPNSVEDFIYREIILSDNFKKLNEEIETALLTDLKIKVEEIFNKYSNAPYGLTKSIISILLLNAISKNIDKLAIYEKGQFTLTLDYLVFDRMICCPQNFELQKTVAENNSLLEDISEFLLPNKTNNILEITKGLYRFIKSLDKYTLNTERLTKSTLRFKNVVMNAKDPISLFYRDIPKVLVNKQLNECDKTFVNAFKTALKELKTAKENLSNELFDFTLNTFKTETREELSQRFDEVQEYIGDKELKILSNNILDTNCNDTLWIDRIATFINKSRVPKDWSDSDIADFKVKLKELALKFVTIESTTGNINIKLDDSLTSLLNQVLQLPTEKKNIFLRRVVNG